MPTTYDSREDAAKAALEEAMGLSFRYEYAGVIYQENGKFYYTPPKTSRREHNVEVKVQYPKGSKLMGLYHTHPAGDDSQFFSQMDIEVARQLGIPYFMGNLRDKSLRMFHPKSSPVSKGNIGSGSRGGRALYSGGDPLELPKPPDPVSPPPPQLNERASRQENLSVISRRFRLLRLLEGSRTYDVAAPINQRNPK